MALKNRLAFLSVRFHVLAHHMQYPMEEDEKTLIFPGKTKRADAL